MPRIALNRTTPRTLLGAAALLLGLAAALYAGSGGEGADQPPRRGGASALLPRAGDAAAVVSVQGAPVTRGTLVVPVRAAGQAEAGRRTSVTALVRGRVLSTRVRESDAVSAGEVVVVLDATEHQLSVQEADAALRDADARFRDLVISDDQIADPAVRAERERTARARSGLESARVRQARARIDLERTRIATPFSGRVASVRVVAGQWVEPGTELMTLVDLQPVRVEVQVLESELRSISPGARARVVFAAFPGQAFAGTVETVNPLVERGTRAARVTLSVPNPGERILPGMYARAELDALRYEDRLLVPRGAVLRRDGRTLLFLFRPGTGRDPGRAEWRYVETGVQNDSLVEVLPAADAEPPQPGDVVLVGGHQMLVHDARVRLDAAAAPASSPREGR